MKHLKKYLFQTLTAAAFIFCACALTGCATTDDEYVDDDEYSNMPWNTPKEWEGSRSIPGLSGGGGGY